MSTSASALALARAVVAHAPTRAGGALLLLLMASATEGLSVLMFVPALELLRETGDLRAGGQILALARAAGITPSFETAIGIAAVLLLVRALCISRRTRTLTRVLADFTDAQRTRLFSSLANARWSRTRHLLAADIEHALTDDVERVEVGVQALLQLAQAGVVLAAYSLLSMLVSPAMTLLVGAMGVLLVVLQRPARRAATVLGERYGAERAEVYRVLGSLAADLKIAKSHGTESTYVDRFGRATDASRRTTLAFASLAADANALFQAAAAVCLAAAMLVGAQGLGLGASQLLLLVLFVARMVPAIAGVQTSLQRLRYGLPGYTRVEALGGELSAVQDRIETGGAPFTLEIGIDLTHVTVTPSPGSSPVLSVSARIPARMLTVIAGPSGAGKTTLVDLVLGLLEPTTGTVRADGRDITSTNARAWRRHTAYVPQDPALFPGSVRANLLLGAPQANEAAIWRTLKLAAADAWVAALPAGLDCRIGPGGVILSGGERQRLALARALLRRPSLLVLDEATSALDPGTEAQVLGALAALRGELTVLAVAHRTAVLAHADHVMILDGGRLVEQGPIGLLLDQPGTRTAQLLRMAASGPRVQPDLVTGHTQAAR